MTGVQTCALPILIKFKSIENRNDAVSLAGLFFFKSKDEIIEIGEKNKYYVFDLIGVKVFENNKNVGEIIEINFDKDSEYYLIISCEDENRMVPFNKNFIDSVDLKENVIKLKNLEGFFDVEN